MHRAPLAVTVRPQFLHRPDQPWRSVGDEQHWRPQPATDQAAPHLQPVLEALPLTEHHVEQDPLPRPVIAPGHQHALLGAARPGRQVDRVAEQHQQLHLAQAVTRNPWYRARSSLVIWLTVLFETCPRPASLTTLSMSPSDSPRTQPPMISASSGLVRSAVHPFGIMLLTNFSAAPRICGIWISSSPSAVCTWRGRFPFGEPRASAVRSYRARPRKAV